MDASTNLHWQWTVPQLSIVIIYNSTWSILIQKIRIILSGDNLTQKTLKEDPFTRSKHIYRIGRSFKFCGTVHRIDLCHLSVTLTFWGIKAHCEVSSSLAGKYLIILVHGSFFYFFSVICYKNIQKTANICPQASGGAIKVHVQFLILHVKQETLA